MAWWEVYDHVERAKRQQGAERAWQLQRSVFPEADAGFRTKLQSSVNRMARFSLLPGASLYEQVSDAERRRLIGSAVTAAGVDWLQDHPAQLDWLEDCGVSVQVCVSEYAAHMAAAEVAVGWRAARKA